MPNHPKFFYTHFVYPLVVLMVLSLAINIFAIDTLMADYFYSMQGHNWAWKNSWWAEGVIHKGGRNLSIVFALAVLALLIKSHYRNPERKQAFCYLLIAAGGSSLLVNLFKSLLGVSCPWEFERYGGHLVYKTVVEQLVLRNGDGCFPAGHASAGYAWIALYFIGLHYHSRLRWTGLLVSIFAGLVFGFAQQVRGAHFISHDVWTLALCWFYSLALYLLMFRQYPSRQIAVSGAVISSNL